MYSTENRKNRPIITVLLVIFLIGLCSICALLGSGKFLITGDRVQKVGAIVVLSGDEGARVREASKIYLAGMADYVIITKSDHEDIQENRTYSEKMMRIAINEGVASDSILFTNQEAGDTIGEAREVLEVCNQRKINSILVVTDPFHTRRTKIIFTNIFEDSEITTSVHGISDHWYKAGTWFLTPDGWRKTIEEYGALILLALGSQTE
jgi:uncharacterized SAM-binding protein YcdF (DUF218 family)